MSYKFKYGNQEIAVPKKSESLCYQYDLGDNVNLNNICLLYTSNNRFSKKL